MSGQRVERVTITPFSVENESLGRPWMFQSRTALGSARNMEKSKFSEAGMCRALTCARVRVRAWPEQLRTACTTHTHLHA